MGDCLTANVVADLVAGSLDPGLRQSAEQHIDGCAVCRALMAEVVMGRGRDAPTMPAGSAPAAEGRNAGTGWARGTAPLPLGFRGSDRFAVVRWLGAGGMGAVYEVLDRSRGEHVALKTLDVRTPDQLLRFKNEFREVQDIHHPNLVSLGDLMQVDGVWFFTMELIAGGDFLAHVRPRRVVDRARLRAAVLQLVDAIGALHAAGKVHRDLKPSNVLVTPAGRVVVLDFGLITDATDDRAAEAAAAVTEELAVGTAYYMAPEQARGQPVAAAADWYALGAMIYEALTGSLPYPGHPLEVLMAKQAGDAPRPLPPADEDDLARLAEALLRIDPAERPDEAEIRTWLSAPQADPLAEAAPFVGRRPELAALAAAMARGDGPRIAHVVGDSGIGKTALVREFLAGAAPRATVLAGRCYERELLPFKAVDGLVDALARHLRHQPDHEVDRLLTADAGLLSQVFPVLDRVRAIRRRPKQLNTEGSHEVRVRVFAALQTMLTRLGRARPLVLFIDDLQWSDVDSLVLLQHLLRGPQAVPAFAIFTSRPGWPGPAWLVRDPDVTTVALGGLDAADAAALADGLSDRLGGGRRGLRVDDAGGHPLLLAELVRQAAGDGTAVDLDEVLWARIERLDRDARDLLEVVAVAGAPVPLRLAADAARVPGAAFYRPHAILRGAHLIRSSAVETVDTYHDRIRELVLARLPAPARRAAHHALALASESAAEPPPPDMLSLHWEGAGDSRRAARWAVTAAERARAQLAFDHAAGLFRRALDLSSDDGPPEQSRLLERLAEALAQAGRGRQAADAYLAAAATGAAADPLELRRCAAEQLLLSGHVDDGRALLRDVIVATGLPMPASELRALVQLLVRRLRLALRRRRWPPPPARALPPADRVRIDICYSASVGLVAIDPLRSAFFQSQGLLLALRARDPVRIARALALEISLIAGLRGPAHRAFYRAWTRARAIAQSLADPSVSAIVDGSAAGAAVLGGRWTEALELCARAERLLLQRCTGTVWERDILQMLWCNSLWYVGRLDELAAEVPARLRDACERGDRLASTNLRTGLAFTAWLIADDPDGGARELGAARAEWSQAEFHVQHAQMVHAEALLALYQGDAGAARDALLAARPGARSALLHHIQMHRIMMSDLEGRAALAAALVRGIPPRRRKRLIAEASRAARRLARERVAWARALGAVLAAEVLAARGDTRRAIAATTRAEEACRIADLELHAVIARRRRGQLLGEDGRFAVADSDRWLAERGVRKPAELARVLAPLTAPERWR